MTKHNADPHVTFYGVRQGINHYVVVNGTVSTGSAWGTYESVTAYLRYNAQLPDTPKSPYQRFWWELAGVHAGGPRTSDAAPAGPGATPKQWTCACAARNPGDSEDCRGCHLTRAGQGEPMPPCTCGCDTSPGRYGDYDTESSVSRQHFIDTGRFLRHGEILDTP